MYRESDPMPEIDQNHPIADDLGDILRMHPISEGAPLEKLTQSVRTDNVGMIAFGLLILFLFVGYQAAIKLHGPRIPVTDTPDTRGESYGTTSASPPNKTTRPTQDQKIRATKLHPLNAEATRKLLHSAADQHQYAAAIGYGQQIYDSGSADSNDLLIIVQSYFSSGDCANALTWIDRAHEGFRAAGSDPEALRRMRRRCESVMHAAPDTMTAAERERAERLLNHFKSLAEADRKRLPELGAPSSAKQVRPTLCHPGRALFRLW